MARGDGQGGCACASRRMRGGRAGAHLGHAGLFIEVYKGWTGNSDWSQSGPNAAGGAARRMTVRTSEKAQAKRDMRARVSGGGPGVLARRGASRRPRCSFIFTPRHKLGWGGRGPGPPPRASGGVGG